MTEIDMEMAIDGYYDGQLPPDAEEDPWEVGLPRLSGSPEEVALASAVRDRMLCEVCDGETANLVWGRWGLPSTGEDWELRDALCTVNALVGSALAELGCMDDTDWLLDNRRLGGADLVAALDDRREARIRSRLH